MVFGVAAGRGMQPFGSDEKAAEKQDAQDHDDRDYDDLD